ncbi:MAG TPA: hydantoinase/oxoprolinase family protein, partial [Terriglobales bacterium]|nr:hydantoinase/oxoprolinase family protein [Terriglobales bacterium]
GIIRVVNATMEKAIRVVSIERGYDSREFTLVAFGGAGGLHACELAEGLGIPRVIVPALPGALSAYGILVSDVVKDFSRTVLWRVSDPLPAGKLKKEFDGLQRRAADQLRKEGWGGRVHFQLSADVRYRGQGYELNVPYSSQLIEDFRREHQRRYGYGFPGRELELVTLRLRAGVKSAQVKFEREKSLGSAAVEWQSVFFGGKFVKSALYPRERLTPGRRVPGPAVVTEYSATTVVPPGRRFGVDRVGNLMVWM